MANIPGLPPVWAIILGIAVVLFGSTGGIVWMIRRELRDSRLQPGIEKQQELESQETAQRIANMLAEAQEGAVSQMRALLDQAREEAAAATQEAHKARTESRLLRIKVDEVEAARQRDRDAHDAERLAAQQFRELVGRLVAELRANGVVLPPWWVEGA